MTKDEVLQNIIDKRRCRTEGQMCKDCYFHMHYYYKKKNENKISCYLLRFRYLFKTKTFENLISFIHRYKLKKIKRLLK